MPLLVGAIAIAILFFIKRWEPRVWKKQFNKKIPLNNHSDSNTTCGEEQINQQWTSSYQPRYLLTINEKQQFRKLKAWAASHDAIVFTKVRVLDLIEPRRGIQNYKSLFYKIQAKHVDFVVCDQDVRVKCIIELDDNSHNNQKREERDNFLREALSGAGYKVLHTRYITPEFLNQI